MKIYFVTKKEAWYLDFTKKRWEVICLETYEEDSGRFSGQPIVKIGWPVTIHSASEDYLSKITVTDNVLNYKELV